jgi:hypothetical protein
LQFAVICDQPSAHLIHSVLYGFAENRLLEIAAAEVRAPRAEAMPIAAATERSALA